MRTLRTPDERFDALSDFAHEPRYAEIADAEGGSLRIAYVESGPSDGPVVLLLHRSEITRIERKVNESGFTIVPLTLYFKDGRAKVEIALARGKKTWDKRHALAERQATREVEAEFSRRLKGRRE